MQSTTGEDFIRVFGGVLSAERCRTTVEQFERSGLAGPGETGGGVRPEVKRSFDLRISGRSEWAECERTLGLAVLACLLAYARELPFVVLAPFALELPDDARSDTRTVIGPEALRELDDERLTAVLAQLLMPGATNLQKYRANEGGYPRWHSEIYPHATDASTLRRVLLWTIYLNEEFSGGETEFLHQQRKIIPRTGAVLLAPGGFTHTHRGNRPEGGDKYIATGWIEFRSVARVYR